MSAAATEAPAALPMDDRAKLALYVDLFKYYLELILKVSVFAAAVVGGIMAYAVGNKAGIPPASRLGFFMVPVCLSFAIAAMAWRHIASAREMHVEVVRLGKQLNLTPPPHVHLLVDATIICSVAYFALGGGVLLVAVLI
ncbi:MAG: hypothetical protein E6G97_14255 [Alphaproteobacteria bacterium]|nr:MAG: hypothetical protein E6G97_14255 [Alphaproteobacteria bacterium]